MSEGWILQGWLYRNNEAKTCGPVSETELLELLAKGRLKLTDILCKQFAYNGETCISSPVSLEDGLRTG
jgi:hypothetical protein